MNARSIAQLIVLAQVAGCSASYRARSSDEYREDTRALLEARSDSFLACYQSVLDGAPGTMGTVAVHFVVEPETGKISKATSLPESTAPEPLQQCVVQGLQGLVLDPPDEHEGSATMQFDFAEG